MDESVMPAQAPPRPEQPPGFDWGAPLLVWGTWASMLLALLGYVGFCGPNMPQSDEWHWVPVMLGEVPLTFGELWQQDFEHRVPLTRLSVYVLAKLTGCDFRAGMFASALILGALACVLILAARRLRGWTSYSDAFFPLALLHFGHFKSLLEGWTVGPVTSAFLENLPLLVLIQGRERPSLRGAVLVGLSLLLLPMYGAQGVALVPALALWLTCLGVLSWRSPGPKGRRDGAVMVALAAASLSVVAVYFVGMERQLGMGRPSRSLRSTLGGVLGVLSTSLGSTSSFFLPYSGLAILGLWLLCGAILVAVWRRQPQERLRVLGLLSFLGAVGSLALAIGWGRGGMGSAAASHYSIFALPVLFCLYLLGSIYRPATGGRLLQMSLFLLLCLALPLNTYHGLSFGRALRAKATLLERDIRAGIPVSLLAERHKDLNPSYEAFLTEYQEELACCFRLLREARVGIFKDLQEDPVVQDVSADVKLVDQNEICWEGDTSYGRGSNTYLTFTLDQPRQVYALRLRYSMNYGDAGAANAAAKLSWRESSREDFSDAKQTTRFSLEAGAGEQTVTIWIDDVLDEFRLYPDNKPCVIRVAEITMQVPAPEGTIPPVRPRVRRFPFTDP